MPPGTTTKQQIPAAQPIGSIAMSCIMKPATTVLGTVSKAHLPLKHRIHQDTSWICYIYWRWSSERQGFGAISESRHPAWPCRISSAQLPLYAWETMCFWKQLARWCQTTLTHCLSPNAMHNALFTHQLRPMIAKKKNAGNKYLYIYQMSCEWCGGKLNYNRWWYFSTLC